MKLKTIFIGFLLSIVFVFSSHAKQDDFPVLKGPYLGQKPPGMTPEIFAPGIVSTGLSELNAVFSPTGDEFYFCVANPGSVSIFQMKRGGNIWSGPRLLPFASRFGDIDVTLSPDGQTMLFSSRRPPPSRDQPMEDNDFWMVKRSGNAWGEPIYLGEDINSDRHDYYPMMTNDGTIYFSSQREGPGTNNIYRSKLLNGKYFKAEKLSGTVNTEHREFDPYVSPDERMMIFTSNRPDGFGSGDLYISFNTGNGTWTQAKNMGDTINTAGSEYCAMITPDGKYFFFTGARRDDRQIPENPLAYKDFIKIHNTHKNGSSNIYWVDAKIIEELKPKEMK